MPFQRKTGGESCANNNRKKNRTPVAVESTGSFFGAARTTKEPSRQRRSSSRQQKRTKQERVEVGCVQTPRSVTPKALQGRHSPSPTISQRRLRLPTVSPFTFSPPVETTPSPSGRKTAGMYFPAASSVKSIREFLSNSIRNGKAGGNCCTPTTESLTCSPSGSHKTPGDEPFIEALNKIRDSNLMGGGHSEFDPSTVESLTQVPQLSSNTLQQRLSNLMSFQKAADTDNTSTCKSAPTTPVLSRLRKCRTPDVVMTTTTPTSSTDDSSSGHDFVFHPPTPVNFTRYRQSSFDQGHLQKRCQYLEAEVEYLRDRETELRDRVSRSQAENVQLSSELKATTDTYREALNSKRKLEESYSDQSQSVNRIHAAYNKKAQEVKELKELLEKERREWMESVRAVQEELEKERSRRSLNRSPTPRTPVFTDTDTDISLNDCFEEGSVTPSSSDFQAQNLSSSLNNSPGPSPRSLEDLRRENKRLLEENQRLRADCEALETSRLRCQRKQKLEMLKQKGNKAFQEGKYRDALECYSAACEEVDDDLHTLAVLHCNKAVTLFNMERFLDAIVSCCCALECDPSYPRAYQRRAASYEALGDLSAASQDLTHLIHSKVNSNIAREAEVHLAELQRKIKRPRSIDAYKILGLSVSATGAEVKSRYRKLALKFHPDKARNQPGADEAFKLVSQAHNLLTDETKRRKLDASRLRTTRSASPWL